jgi:hypothetical protein
MKERPSDTRHVLLGGASSHNGAEGGMVLKNKIVCVDDRECLKPTLPIALEKLQCSFELVR